MATTVKSLVLGDSNQIVENNNKHFNVEEYKTLMQFSGPWAVDKIAEIHIMKLYNTVTFMMSYIEGEPPADNVPYTIIQSVPFTLNVQYPYMAEKNLTGKIPQRFLPRNSPLDTQKGTDEPFNKSFGVAGSQHGTGFNHLLTIQNKPYGYFGYEDNGIIKIGFNMSTGGFNNGTTTIEPTCLSWLTDSNINVHASYVN